MYKLLFTKQNATFKYFYNDIIFIGGKHNNQEGLYAFTNDFELLYKVPEEKIRHSFVYKDNIICITGAICIARNINDIHSICYSIDLNAPISNKYVTKNMILLYDIYNNVIKIDLDIGSIINIVKDTTSAYVFFATPKYIVDMEADILYIRDHNYKVVWQKEFSEIAAYNDPLHDTPMKGEISKVYLYKEDRIIVCTKYNTTYCFELTTGKLIWESKSYARTIEIVGEVGYICTGLNLYKLNLETGERSEIYTESKGRMPDIIRGEDDVLWPSGHEVVFHDGLLWYSFYSSGYSYLLAINPHDGHYEWMHEVKTHEQTDSPKFYKDKMYLRDTGGLLHVYEKEN